MSRCATRCAREAILSAALRADGVNLISSDDICVNSISSVYAHYKLGNIEIEVLKKWYIGVVLGSILGAFFASSINGNLLVIIFVFIASLVAISMFLNFNIILANNLPKSFLLNNTISFIIGFFSVLIGIGGGSFSVPTLTVFGKNIHRAVGTSASIGFCASF